MFSLSETQRQTIVEIVSLFPSLSELQLKSIETLVVSPYLQKQSIISLVVSGAAVSASGSPPVLSAELEKKFTTISNLLSKASDEKINEKLRPIMTSLAEAGQSNVGGSVALTQKHSKLLDDAFEAITHVRQLTNTPSAVLSNLIKLTPAGATKLLGRNSLSSYGGRGGEAGAASPTSSSQQARFPVPETFQQSEKRREKREKDGDKDDLSRSNLPEFVTHNSPLNLRLDTLGGREYDEVRMAAYHLATEAAFHCHANMTTHALQTYMTVAEVNKQIHRFFTLAAGMLVEMGYPPARSIVDNLEKLKELDEEVRPDISCLPNPNDMAAYHLACIPGLYCAAAGSIFAKGFDSTALSKAACRKVADVYNFDFGDEVTQFQPRLNEFVDCVEQAQKMTPNLDNPKKINLALNVTNMVAVAMASFGVYSFSAYDVSQAKLIIGRHSKGEIGSLVALQAIIAESVAAGYFIASEDSGEFTKHALAAATAAESSAAASAALAAKSANVQTQGSEGAESQKKKKSKSAKKTSQNNQRAIQYKAQALAASSAGAAAAPAAPVAVTATSLPSPAAPPKKPYKSLTLQEKEEKSQYYYTRNVAKVQEVLQRSGKNPDAYLESCVLNGEYTFRWRPGAPTLVAASVSAIPGEQLSIRAVQNAFNKGTDKYLGDQYVATLVRSAFLGATGDRAPASTTAPPPALAPASAPASPPAPAQVPFVDSSVFLAPSSQTGMGTQMMMVPVPMPGGFHSGAQGGPLQMPPQMSPQQWQQGQFYSQQPQSRHALAAQGFPRPPGYGIPMGYQGMAPHLGHPSVDQRLLQAPRENRDKDSYDVFN